MTVTDGELQIRLDVGRDSVRKTLAELANERTRSVFAWTDELGIPVLPLSAAEDTGEQLRRLLGAVPAPQGRGGRHAVGAGLG
jgi:hypothetical protein